MNGEPKFDTKKDLKKALDAIDTTIDDASPEGDFPQLPVIATYFATLSQVKEDDEQHYVREPPSTYDLGRSGIFSLAPGGFEAHEGDIILTSRDEEKEIHVIERHGTGVTAAFLKSQRFPKGSKTLI